MTRKLTKIAVCAIICCSALLLKSTPLPGKTPTSQTSPATSPTSGPEIAQPTPSAPNNADIPDWQVRWELARVLGYSKKYDEAIRQYNKLLADKPDLLDAKVELAAVLFWSQRKDEALAMVEGINPSKLKPASQAQLAELYAVKQDYSAAEAIYRDLLRTSPDDLKLRLKLAQILSWSKQYDKSIEQYGIVLKAKPDDIQVRRQYAMVLIWAGRNAEGAIELEKTLPPITQPSTMPAKSHVTTTSMPAE
ncbi:MAG: tetratricopeptide repeat protein [Planctomycetaceae bacterium]|nr:MAG: tetratricopeptide repeat protein [Planctomycetaceae bacterium]